MRTNSCLFLLAMCLMGSQANGQDSLEVVTANSQWKYTSTTYVGQSFTTGDNPSNNINFEVSGRGGPAFNADAGFLLSEEYLGLPEDLSSSTPGFIGQSTSIGPGFYPLRAFVFDPSITLAPNTKYYFYTNQKVFFASNNYIYSGKPDYIGGEIYSTSIYVEEPFKHNASGDLYFTVWGGLGSTNEAPTADAGANQSIRAGDTVILDGSVSYDDNTAQLLLAYEWSFISKPTASVADLDDNTLVMPSFVADIAGTYKLSLVVTDDGGLSSEAVIVEISSDNLAPTAVATSNLTLAVIGDEVALSGSQSSDPDDDPLIYSWNITSAPLGSTAGLVGANTATPTISPDVEGTYALSLEVSDFLGAGTPATVEFTATTASGFAEIVIVEVSDQVTDLIAGQVTTAGNQNAFSKHLANAVQDLQDGLTVDAIDKLNKAISRTDGCALRGSPDGNGKGRDWITDCIAQAAIYELLTMAVETLQE